MNTATDRQTVKDSILSEEDTDPELDETFHKAQDTRIDAIREANRHIEAKAKIHNGLFGLLGARDNAPYNIALIALLLSFLGFIVCLTAGGFSKDQVYLEFWSRNAERSIAVALTSLAYIFGRSGSQN